MKNLVMTLTMGDEYESLGKITHPLMLKYARRIGAKFMVSRPHRWPYCAAWGKLSLFDLLMDWDRIIYLDTDLIINAETCPDLFEFVPETHFGAFVEGRISPRDGPMVKAIQDHKLETKRVYDGEYFNSGVMVLSRRHRDIFKWPETVIDNMYEQSLLNARVFTSNIPFCELNYKLNRMRILDGVTGEDRHASHIIHYAGSNDKPRVELAMRDDISKWERKEPAKTRFYVEVGGGLGDVICSEPVMRYAIEDLYHQDQDVLWKFVTKYPRVFKHFSKYPNVEIFEKEFEMDPTLPFVHLQTHPQSTHLSRSYFSYHAVHNLDFGSYCMIRDILPPLKKKIFLETHPEDYKELLEVSGAEGWPAKTIAVHPGVGWPSKTFPLNYWQTIIDGLADCGFIVALMGRDKYLPVKCPSRNGLDFRDKISMGATIKLIELCPILLSNDSSPVHMAGAFDNWIVMIATCKRPELVFPFRGPKGDVTYKTLAIYDALTCENLDILPNNPHGTSIAEVRGELMDYLPAPERVVREIKAIELDKQCR